MSPLPKLRLPLAPAPLLLPVVVREFIRSIDQPTDRSINQPIDRVRTTPPQFLQFPTFFWLKANLGREEKRTDAMHLQPKSRKKIMPDRPVSIHRI